MQYNNSEPAWSQSPPFVAAQSWSADPVCDSTEYDFSDPYIQGPPINSDLGRLTAAAFNSTTGEMVKDAFETPCCPNPPPCQERVAWQAKFKRCPTTFVNVPQMQVPVNEYGDRYSVADLNPLLLERSRISGAKWNPYEHMNARQMFAQFISKDIRKDGDQYSKPVKNLDDTYAAKFIAHGPPKYVLF